MLERLLKMDNMCNLIKL